MCRGVQKLSNHPLPKCWGFLLLIRFRPTQNSKSNQRNAFFKSTLLGPCFGQNFHVRYEKYRPHFACSCVWLPQMDVTLRAARRGSSRSSSSSNGHKGKNKTRAKSLSKSKHRRYRATKPQNYDTIRPQFDRLIIVTFMPVMLSTHERSSAILKRRSLLSLSCYFPVLS